MGVGSGELPCSSLVKSGKKTAVHHSSGSASWVLDSAVAGRWLLSLLRIWSSDGSLRRVVVDWVSRVVWLLKTERA